ncbi:MAG: hypothetical protein ABIH23_19745 [bacterium]
MNVMLMALYWGALAIAASAMTGAYTTGTLIEIHQKALSTPTIMFRGGIAGGFAGAAICAFVMLKYFLNKI